MEKVFVGDKSTDWYKRCRQYLDNNDIQFEKAKEICNRYGIDEHNIALDYNTLYLKYGEKYPDDVIKMFKSSPYSGRIGTFNIVKKNSKLGKEIAKADIHKQHSPMVGFDLFGGIAGIKYGQFIHKEHVYIRVISETELKCPEGFTEMKLSDFFLLVENIKNNDDLHLENI